MFRSILAHILIFFTMAANFSQVFVRAGFELNESYIVSKLCINRDKPQMHCNGKCYLMRKLKQAEQKERNRAHENQRSMYQLGVVVEKLSFNPYMVRVERIYKPELPFLLPAYAADIFQPPRV
ncbi:hypothetical protein HDF26_000755 [Pedobacter cryoconitis]|uniref:Uncharacterized protein n=1 Tax=Pedobacter cryoconitis TaxID=188932 RepID=A0A7W9E1Q2_9SPHI|nr:hypothetical protein [Pedobacter cryoconitis]MBB5637915.1 hypothetical protein [Pedobacter cryoconitis]MBB6270328.1 hypothetical protein [Pedobacter cryoconitis]